MKIKFIIASAALFLVSQLSGAVFIQNYQDGTNATQATFLSNSGSALTSGGISIGYFIGNTAPSLAQVQALTLNPSTAYSTLVSTYGYVDVRSVPGAVTQAYSGFAGSFDWTFGDILGNGVDIAGQVQLNVAPALTPAGDASATLLPSGARLYLLAFDAGSFLNGFSGSTQWAFTGETNSTGTVPADTLPRNVRVGSMDGAEVWVGTEDGANIRLAAVPEPTKTFLSFGVFVALGLRRRR